MKKAAVFGVVAMLAFSLTGCAGGGQPAQQSSASSAAPEAQTETVTADFDGTGATDTGEGIMFLRTAGGTSENGNVPEITGQGTLQIELDTDGMDGSVCTVYVDGMENSQINAGAMTQNTLTLTGADLDKGTHTVELVKLDDSGAPVIYKIAEYKVA